MAHTIFWLVLLVALDGTRGVLGVRTGGRAVVLIMSVPPRSLHSKREEVGLARRSVLVLDPPGGVAHCVCACVRAFVRVCVCVCVCVCV